MRHLSTAGLLIAALLGAALLVSPSMAWARAYRCTQANGSTSFQDHPCPGTARGNDYALPTAQGYAPPPAPAARTGTSASPAGDAAQLKALGDQLDAADKETRCRNARLALAVLNEQHPVYSRDDSGNRVYLEDRDRPAATAAAQEMVDSNCE